MAKRVADELREQIEHLESELEILSENTYEESQELEEFREATAELLRLTGVQGYQLAPTPESVRAVIKALKEKA